MRVFIYNGGLRLVGKSGVGQAILHQREMLRRARIDTADHWCQRAGAVHINTVLPDSVLAALAAKLMGRKEMSARATRPGSCPRRSRTHRVGRDRGVQRFMEPKAMTSPRGSAPIRVTKNSSRVTRNPWFKAISTVWVTGD